MTVQEDIGKTMQYSIEINVVQTEFYVLNLAEDRQRRIECMTQNDEEKVIHVFERRRQKMDPKDAFNATPFLAIIVLCIVALIVSIVVGYVYHRADIKENARLNEKILFLEKRADMLMDKLDRAHAANAYRDHVRLTGMKIKRSDNELTMSGEIYNTGRKQVAEIVITIYMLDGQGTIIDHHSFTYRSQDRSPLKTNKKRAFSYSMQSPPIGVKEVSAVITDIVFEK
jgi:hypothetical protein